MSRTSRRALLWKNGGECGIGVVNKNARFFGNDNFVHPRALQT
jgi:hypothetical protein